MTILRLVSDEPTGDVAAEARSFADAVDDGQLGKVNGAIVITSGSALVTHYWGNGLDLIGAIGVLEAAKHHIIGKLLES